MAAVCGYDRVDHHVVALTHRRTEQMLSARGRCSKIPAARLSCPRWSACSPRLPASASGRKAATVAACSRGGVEVAAGEVRIIGSKSRMLQTLVSSGGVNTQCPFRGRVGGERRIRTHVRVSNFSSHPGTTAIPPRVPGAFYRALEPIRRRQRRLSGFQGAQNRVSGWPMIQSSPSERRFLGPPRL